MRLERILLELLDFAKPLKIQRDPCSINEVLSSAIELLEVKFRQKKVAMVDLLAPDLAPVRADGEKLGQAFINLLLNAFEASPSQGKVWIASMRKDSGTESAVQVRIEDEGGGFGTEAADHLFEPFFTTKTRGTGLGLTNVKRIVEAHGGKVAFSSGASGGARFDIWLPAEE